MCQCDVSSQSGRIYCDIDIQFLENNCLFPWQTCVKSLISLTNAMIIQGDNTMIINTRNVVQMCTYVWARIAAAAKMGYTWSAKVRNQINFEGFILQAMLNWLEKHFGTLISRGAIRKIMEKWNEASIIEDQIRGRSGRPNENIALLRVAHQLCAPLRSLSGV